MLALGWLAREGRHSEPDFRAYIGRLFHEMLPPEPDYVWYNLVVTAAIMGYGEFAAENRPAGWNVWLTFAISPMAPTAVTPTRHIVTK